MASVAPLLLDEPTFLYRFFDRPEHACSLRRAGMVRLQRLQYYQDTEQIHARDELEGDGQLLVPGMLPRVALDPVTGASSELSPVAGHFNFSTSWINPTYVLCASAPSADLPRMLKDRPHPISIFGPHLFAAELLMAAEALDIGDRELFRLEGMLVRYDKGEVGIRPEDIDERIRLSVAQKPRRFEYEAEYRFALYMSGPGENAPPFLDLTLSSPERFCG